MNDQTIVTLLILSGIGHLCMSLGSIAVPTLLDWKKPLATVPPLLRQVFWTYSTYIKGINISFGLVSIFGAHELIDGSFLAKCLNGFIVIYWFARFVVEFAYFDRTTLKGIAKTADITLDILIVLFILVHGAAFARNFHLI
jgi:hypothetical protein